MLQDVASLEERRRLKIHQLNFFKQASTITQVYDTGNLYKRERHHVKHISIQDIPTPILTNPLAEDFQKLRDTDKLIVPAKTLEHILNVALQLPTVLLKLSDPKSNIQNRLLSLESLIMDHNVNVMMTSNKKLMTVELKRKCLVEIPDLLTHLQTKGRILEGEFENLGHPIDTDNNGIEHILSHAFAKQHQLQWATILTTPQFIRDFAAAQEVDSSAVVQENVIAGQAEEVRWRDQILSANTQYDDSLSVAAGHIIDNYCDEFAADFFDSQLPNHSLFFIASKRASATSSPRHDVCARRTTLPSKSKPNMPPKVQYKSVSSTDW